jgi:hypothetical protein
MNIHILYSLKRESKKQKAKAHITTPLIKGDVILRKPDAFLRDKFNSLVAVVCGFELGGCGLRRLLLNAQLRIHPAHEFDLKLRHSNHACSCQFLGKRLRILSYIIWGSLRTSEDLFTDALVRLVFFQ